MPVRLAIEKTTIHRGWDNCALAADGRALLQAWNYQKADRFQLDGKSVALPNFEERRLFACGNRFVFLGHPWEDKTPAKVIVIDGKKREFVIPRNHAHHFLGCWLAEDDRLAIVASDTFHVVHGIAITEVKLAKKTKASPIMKVGQLKRHIGKGHAELSLQTVMRAGDRLFALASAGYRYRALLELEPKAKSFGSRVVVHAKADNAVFSADGQYVVMYERRKPAAIYALDGTKLATFTPKVPAGDYLDLVSAAPNVVAFRAGKKGVHVVRTSPWPGGATGALADVPASEPIADLPIDTAKACSPEPVSYRGKPPRAFGAVIGWTLNAPTTKKPTITHAIVTDLIINFFAKTDGKLRLLFNFDLSAIQRVLRDGDQVTIVTPSGRTILRTTRRFSAALLAATR